MNPLHSKKNIVLDELAALGCNKIRDILNLRLSNKLIPQLSKLSPADANFVIEELHFLIKIKDNN